MYYCRNCQFWNLNILYGATTGNKLKSSNIEWVWGKIWKICVSVTQLCHETYCSKLFERISNSLFSIGIFIICEWKSCCAVISLGKVNFHKSENFNFAVKSMSKRKLTLVKSILLTTQYPVLEQIKSFLSLLHVSLISLPH